MVNEIIRIVGMEIVWRSCGERHVYRDFKVKFVWRLSGVLMEKT